MVLQHISIANGTLTVEVTGTNSGPLVICGPGMGDTRDSYNEFAAYLVSHGFTVATIDPRGHGDSSIHFDSYGDLAMSEDYILVAETLRQNTNTRVVLAGSSFSGGAATIAASKRPDLVAGTVLLSAFLRNGSGAWFLYIIALMFLRPWGPMVWEMFAATLWPGLGQEKAKARAKETRAKLTREPGRWRAFQKTVAGCDHRVVAPYVERTVDVAALVVMGEKDPDFSKPKEEAEWTASRFRDGEVVMVPEVGHAPYMENPEFVGEKTVAFLERLRRDGAFENGRS